MTRLIQNGTRHTQAMNVSGEENAVAIRKATLPRTTPIGTPSWAKLPKNPRRCAGALSVATSTAPPHCAPTARPWAIRSVTRRAGASQTTCVLGTRPIRVVATAIRTRAPTRTGLRPYLSPS